MKTPIDQVIEDVTAKINEWQTLLISLQRAKGIMVAPTPSEPVKEPCKVLRENSAPSKPVKVKKNGNRIANTGDAPVKLSEVMRVCIRKFQGKWFTRLELSNVIEASFPALKDKAGATGVNCINMVARGELERKGAGASTLYKELKLKTSGRAQSSGAKSEKEKNWSQMRGQIESEIAKPAEDEPKEGERE